MSEKSIYEILHNVQQELKAPKGQYNEHYKFNYRSCEDILESVKPILKKHGVVIFMSDEVVIIGDRFYVKAIAKIINKDGSDNVGTYAYAREDEIVTGKQHHAF